MLTFVPYLDPTNRQLFHSEEPKDLEVEHLYFDHVCRNTSKQDVISVLSILELVCRRIKRDMDTIQTMIIRACNAGNYRNKLIPVVSPFIPKNYGIRIRSILQNEPCNGKGPAYLHFAIAMRYVKRYINNLESDFVTAEDLVLVFNYGDGIPGTVAELLDVHKNFDAMKKWKDVHCKSQTQGGLANLDAYSIVRYGNLSYNALKVSIYAYSYSRPVHWK